MPRPQTKPPTLPELKYEARIVRCLILGEPVGRSTGIWTAGAVTRIPGEVRARFLRERRRSVVEADVEVEAADPAGRRVQAVVRVTLEYAGDAVRSSPVVREGIGDRIMEVASRACCEHVGRQIGLPLQKNR